MATKIPGYGNQLFQILVDYEKSDKPKLFLTKKEFYSSLHLRPLKSIKSIFISAWEGSSPLLLKIKRMDIKRWMVTKGDEFCFLFFFDSADNFLDILWGEFRDKTGISVNLTD